MTHRSIAAFIIEELAARGVRQVFGVAGDYSFPLTDACCEHRELRWIGCSTEAAAGAMADGAARVSGLGAICTTFGVGELGAMAALAGSRAERVPVIHLVGMPPTGAQARGALLHHSIGDGRFDHWIRAAECVTCDRALLTAENAGEVVPRVLDAAIREGMPAYLGVPRDVADAPARAAACCATVPSASDTETLTAAVAAIAERVAEARQACLVVSALAVRLGLREQLLELVERSGIPFVAMWTDKSAVDESHPQFMGVYAGQVADARVAAFVESCDLVVNVGALENDLNLGGFTGKFQRRHMVVIGQRTVSVGAAAYNGVLMADVLKGLSQVVERRTDLPPHPTPKPLALAGAADEPLSADSLYARLERFIQSGDMVFVETGTTAMGMLPVTIPRGADCHTQGFWGAIGWAFPAGVGAAIACPARRCVIVTGEGAFQYHATEVGTASRYGASPIVIVVNNGGYLTERILSAHPDYPYNDIPAWDYTALPRVAGAAHWKTARVQTCAQLEAALACAMNGGPCLIEIITPADALPPIAQTVQRFLSHRPTPLLTLTPIAEHCCEVTAGDGAIAIDVARAGASPVA